MPLGRKVAEEDICEADVVIYVISRISGEGNGSTYRENPDER